jgi:hypothetical protein
MAISWKTVLILIASLGILSYIVSYTNLSLLMPSKYVTDLHRKSVGDLLYSKDPGKTCQWSFLNYTPSSWEDLWYNNIDTFQNMSICNRLYSSQHLDKIISVTQRLIELQAFGRNTSMSDNQNTDAMLSRMFYRQTCFDRDANLLFTVAEVSQLIEPSIGLLRDPFTICPRLKSTLVSPSLYDGAVLQSKRFLLLSVSAPFYVHSSQSDLVHLNKIKTNVPNNNKNLLPWMYQRLKLRESEQQIEVENRKTILMDLGSSYFGGWHGDSTAAAGLWFYQYYKRFGVKFDRVIAYEYSLLDQKAAWTQLPEEIFPVYTLINVGVAESGRFNPWLMLKAVARSYDHVVVKLDIDTPVLENALINQILNDSSIHSLIDEFFFEHHVTVNEMLPYWGRPPRQLKDSYVLFRKLRELGIRMHSWP